MIVSFRHQFIFIKTAKTGGTAVEMALTPYCGPRDIITPITFADERARMIDGVVQARNYSRQPIHEEQFRKAVASGDREEAERLKVDRTGGFVNHIPAMRGKERLSSDLWNRALKFTVVRHPYERLISMLFWSGGTTNALSTAGAFNALLDAISTDVLHYTYNGRLLVDRTIRQETLTDDLNSVLRDLGLAPVTNMPRAKASHRTDSRPAREILSMEQKQAVRARCRLEFDLFGYDP
jgi:hypothetical protein